jgi:hypothetical protein
MDVVERLFATEQVRQLKARFFRCIDTKAFDELRAVFTPDAIFDAAQRLRDPKTGLPPGIYATPAIEGLGQIIVGLEASFREAQSVHHGHSPEIKILSEFEAKAIWPMEDLVLTDTLNFRGYGHYLDRYEKLDDGWRIKTSKLVRLRVIHQPT